MKTHILEEMPWLNIDARCPYDGTPIKQVVDYRVELWRVPLNFKIFFHFKTDKAAKSKYISKLMYADKIPVLCSNPECPGKVFIYDKAKHKATHETPSKDIKELMIQNRDIIYPKGNT